MMEKRNFLSSCLISEGTLTSPGCLFVINGHGRLDASFALHFIVADFLSKSLASLSPKLILLSTSQGERHWGEIGIKFGWNLASLKAKGQLTSIDLLDQEWKGLEDEEEKFPNLDAIFEQISELLENFGKDSDSKVLLVIEDLSALFYRMETFGGNAEKEIVKFLYKLRRLKQASILTFVRSSSSSYSCPSARFGSLISQSLADVVLSLSPLLTGTSPNISGHMTVFDKTRTDAKTPRTAQFKLEEKSIRVNFL